ncbi:MAG: RNA-binding protein [Oligoflexia bacterium]|nr:RNA-binding protein [Oligoflexia bacterium]
MGKKIYVGNLGYGVNDKGLEAIFSAHGTVQSAKVVTDRVSGQSKGFGFVEMSTDEEARDAIQQLNEKEIEGRIIKVSQAMPQERRDNSHKKRF